MAQSRAGDPRLVKRLVTRVRETTISLIRGNGRRESSQINIRSEVTFGRRSHIECGTIFDTGDWSDALRRRGRSHQ